MSHPVSPSLVQDFFQAYGKRDAVRVAPLLADDVEWVMAGPVGVFPFCGSRRGKAAVLAYVARDVPELLSIVRCVSEQMVIDGDSAAMLSRIAAVQSETGRTITYCCAYFARFRDDRLTSLYGLTDTFTIATGVRPAHRRVRRSRFEGCRRGPGANMSAPVIETALQAAGREIPARLLRFYEAFLLRDEGLLDAVLADRIDWLLAGPAEQFDHYGSRNGKRAVIELITRIMPCYYRPSGFVLEHLMVQGDESAGQMAVRVRMRAHQRETGRALVLRSAQFLRFEGKLLTWFRGVPETFDAVEQMVGHCIDVARPAGSLRDVPDDLFAAEGAQRADADR